MTTRGNIGTYGAAGWRLFRVLRSLTILCFVLFALPSTAIASDSEQFDEGGETGVCTDLAESMSARAILFRAEGSTLSPCDESPWETGLSQAPAEAPARVAAQVSAPDLQAILNDSAFEFVSSPEALVIPPVGLSAAEEHRKRSPRPPRRF